MKFLCYKFSWACSLIIHSNLVALKFLNRYFLFPSCRTLIAPSFSYNLFCLFMYLIMNPKSFAILIYIIFKSISLLWSAIGPSRISLHEVLWIHVHCLASRFLWMTAYFLKFGTQAGCPTHITRPILITRSTYPKKIHCLKLYLLLGYYCHTYYHICCTYVTHYINNDLFL